MTRVVIRSLAWLLTGFALGGAALMAAYPEGSLLRTVVVLTAAMAGLAMFIYLIRTRDSPPNRKEYS
jgi:hypothetical protein